MAIRAEVDYSLGHTSRQRMEEAQTELQRVRSNVPVEPTKHEEVVRTLELTAGGDYRFTEGNSWSTGRYLYAGDQVILNGSLRWSDDAILKIEGNFIFQVRGNQLVYGSGQSAEVLTKG